MNQWSDIDDTYTPGVYKKMLKLTKGQGQRSRSYMQACKKLNRLYIMNQLLDMDDTYTRDW